MATNNPKTATRQVTVTRFGGIADHAGLALDAAMDVRNFRILSDGTLEKRCGYDRHYTFPDPLRGLWEGVVSGESYFFAVAGNQIYMRTQDATAPRAIYTMTTSTGEVSFFLYRERLWLMDGTSLLLFRPGTQTFSMGLGYAPLYGYNWHPTALGEVNEPLNLARNEIRVHYFNSNGSTTFNLPFTTRKIRGLWVNGASVVNFSFKMGTSTFTIPTELATVGTVEVWVTLDASFNSRPAVLEASCAKVYQTPHREVMMCHNPNAGYLVYRTTPVTDEMLKTCNLTIADADPMYIAKDTAFAVGSSAHPVTALCQYENHMLVFNDESVWSIGYPSSLSDDAEILPVRAGLGCTANGGVILGGKYPIAVTQAGIARLKFSGYDLDYCQPEILSAGIRNRFDKDFLRRAVLFWDKFRQELWVRDPNDSAGSAWICDPERDVWFRFDDVPAKRFFPFEGNVGFADETDLYCFEESLETDNGRDFTAEYLSHALDSSRLSPPRRSLRLSVVAEKAEDALFTQIRTDRATKTLALSAQTPSPSVPTRFDRRLAMGRFHILQYLIVAAGQSRCRIYSYSLAANP